MFNRSSWEARDSMAAAAARAKQCSKTGHTWLDNVWTGNKTLWFCMSGTCSRAGGGQLQTRDCLSRQLQQSEPDDAAEQAALRVVCQLALKTRLRPITFKR